MAVWDPKDHTRSGYAEMSRIWGVSSDKAGKAEEHDRDNRKQPLASRKATATPPERIAPGVLHLEILSEKVDYAAGEASGVA